MLYRLFRPAGFYAGQRGRRSFRLRKHNLAFLKPLSLSDAVVQFPPVPLSGLADYSDKGDPAGRMSFSGDSAGLLYGRSDSHLRPCKTALVDYLAAGTKTDQIGSCLASCFVVVEEGADHRMSGDKRNGFGQVDDRVQNRGVDVQSFGMFQREISEEIHKSLESDHRVGTVVEGGDVFGRGAAFEPCGAELPPSGVVAETDGEILFAADRVTHLAAISPGDGRVYASPREIADQCRMDLFAVGEDSKAERFRSACLLRLVGKGYKRSCSPTTSF